MQSGRNRVAKKFSRKSKKILVIFATFFYSAHRQVWFSLSQESPTYMDFQLINVANCLFCFQAKILIFEGVRMHRAQKSPILSINQDFRAVFLRTVHPHAFRNKYFCLKLKQANSHINQLKIHVGWAFLAQREPYLPMG